MSLSWGAIGTGASGTTSATPSYPSGITANSALYLVCTGRSNTAGTDWAVTGGGWTNIGTLEGGTGTWGTADVGTRRVTVFRKDTVTGSESGTITVTLAGTTNNTMRCSIVRIEPAAGFRVTEAWASGAYTTNGTGYSATASSNLTFLAGDLLLFATAQNIDTGTATSRAISATDVTFGTITNRADTAVTNGYDHRHIINTAPVNSVSGTPNVAPTFSYTISASGSGPTGFLRLRPEAVISGDATANLAGVTATADATVSVDITPTVSLRPTENVHAQTTTVAKASKLAALLLLVLPGGDPLNEIQLTGATLSADATVNAGAAPAVTLRPTENVHAQTVTTVRANRLSAPLLLTIPAGAPGEATAIVSLAGATVTADAAPTVAGDATLALSGAVVTADGSAAQITSQASTTLAGVTLTASGETEDTVSLYALRWRKTGRVATETWVTSSRRYALAPVEIVQPEVTADFGATLGGISLTATGVTDAILETALLRSRKATRTTVTQTTTAGRRYAAIVGNNVVTPTIPQADGSLNATLAGVTLTASGAFAELEYDLYLGNETRIEAFPKPKQQYAKSKVRHLVTTFNYPPATPNLTATLTGVALSATGTAEDPPNATLTATLDGLTLAATGTPDITATWEATVEGVTLQATAAEFFEYAGSLNSTLRGVTGGGQVTSVVEPQATLQLAGATGGGSGGTQPDGSLATTLDGIGFTANASVQDAPAIFGVAALTLQGVTLEADGELGEVEGGLSVTLEGVTLTAFERTGLPPTPDERTLIVEPTLRRIYATPESRTI
jgi:hypothetical protein